MYTNLNTKNNFTKTKRISSLVIGFVVLFLLFLGVLIFGTLSYLTSYMIIDLKFGSHLGFFVSIIYYLGMIALSILGIGKGIHEKKSQDANATNKGILLGFIDLLLAVMIGFLTALSFVALGV